MAGLEDQVVLITGCSSGIGRALAEEIARRGHRVLATARSRDSVEKFANDRIHTPHLDVTDRGSIEGAVEEYTARAGASQEGAMPTSDFARLVVGAVTASSPPATLRAGKHSVRLPIIGRLPASLRDRIFSRRFGLERLQ